MKAVFKSIVTLFAIAAYVPSTHASEWGFSVGYNNPLGARYGLNVISFWQRYAIEFGIGSAGANSGDDSSSAALAGDIDFKILFASSGLIPYAEIGIGVATSGKVGDSSDLSLDAGNPFVGGGLMYKWHTPFIYAGVDYGISTKKVYPLGGLGIRF